MWFGYIAIDGDVSNRILLIYDLQSNLKMCEVTACFLFIYSVLFDSQNVLLPKLSM